MMKQILVVLFLFSFLISLLAEDHSGTISSDEVWYAGNNPHNIVGNLTVADGVTLTIDPGCIVEFSANLTFTVYGTLIADGTEADHITFTSAAATPAAGDWQYLYFIDPEPGCILDYCDISYGGSSNGSLYLSSVESNLSVTNCVIENGSSHGIYITDSSSPTISNSTISDHANDGIHCYSTNSAPLVSNCTIQNTGGYPLRIYADHIDNIAGNNQFINPGIDYIWLGGDDIYNATWIKFSVPYLIAGNITVSNLNTLTLEEGVELYFAAGTQFKVYGTLIADGTEADHITFTSAAATPAAGDWQYLYFIYPEPGCILDYCDISYGGSSNAIIYLDNCGSNVSFENCSFTKSATSGIYLQNSSHPSIINCIIKDNTLHGINIYGSCTPTFGSSTSEWNDIYNNGNYAIYNGTANLTAHYIYWGTDLESEIQAQIYDHNYNNSLGIVDYTPWMSSPTNWMALHVPANIAINMDGSNVEITWDAVAGATSYKVYSSDDPETGFTEDTTGTFSSESWSAPIPDGKKFYYVKAVN